MKIPPNQINILSARNMDPLVTQTAPSGGGMSVETPAGRKQLSIEAYMNCCVQEEPECVISMADECNCHASKKKTRKSLEVTAKWFQRMRTNTSINWEKCFLFAVVTGISSSSMTYMKEMVENMLKNGAKGPLRI